MNEPTRRKVLFLCVHNASRSIMAEALVNYYLSYGWEAFSAGSDPTEVNPYAIRALREIGIEIPNAKSKHFKAFADFHFDLIVTLCDEARESCPVWLGSEEKEHINFVDPSKATGSDEEILNVFREIRDQIKVKIMKRLSK